MSDPIDIIDVCLGLNTAVDPAEMGKHDLAYAVNAVITEGKRIARADGYGLVRALTDGHSIFRDDGICLVAQGTSLHQVAPDNTLSGIRSGMTGDRICYQQYGNETYYVNGADKGIVRDALSYVWNVGTYNGPTTTRFFEPTIPNFEKIAIHAGRMFGAIGNSLFESELGDFGLWDCSKAFSLAGRIIMVLSVDGGLFVSDEKTTWFLAGSCLDDMAPKQVANYPAIEWGVATEKVEALEIGLSSPGLCSLWLSREGIGLGAPGGIFINITKDRVAYPSSGSRGAALLRGYDLIATLDDSFCTQTALTVGELRGKATTNRSHFPFNSFCRRGDEFLACSDSGIYLLGGDDYNGVDIDMDIETLTTDFGYKGVKSMRRFYLGTNSQGSFAVTPYADDVAGMQIFTENSKTGRQTIRKSFASRLSSGAKHDGRYWKFKIQNVDGADCTINQFSVLPINQALGRG